MLTIHFRSELFDDSEDRVVKLNSCQRDIKTNLRALKLSVGGERGGLNPNIPTDIETEADLLCRRVGVLQPICRLLYALYSA